MLRTISIGTSILAQGLYVASLPDGRITVSVGGKTLSGRPVSKAA
ncbi:hypothetical protein RIdsm_05191 [Roseovarius indicus]|uniref:Uncharacterized protein n=1 Tax=Roseovarius indicus TaxID=540747 RepID=A0A5P3AJ15_9RHOB|nr:hypothetical protein RIdsm_05191 [Roseovarius indicus]SFD75821.1 hypothetical protein SAMN04488031_102310 [Roseovarius indicus]